MDRLEYFEPYQIPATYENALTRAYLTLLRLSPHALSSFLDAVRTQQPKDGVTVPGLSGLRDLPILRTQVGRSLDREEGRVVSIVITGEPWGGSVEIESSDRAYFYDGVIELGDWILVIENKPWNDVWEGQLNPSLPETSMLHVESTLVRLTWRELMHGLNNLLESGISAGGEAMLIDDFRKYVERNFPVLSPFRTISECSGNRTRLTRRCNRILELLGSENPEIAPVVRRTGSAEPLQLKDGPVRLIWLQSLADGESEEVAHIELQLWPGDTIAQARSLYDQLDMQAFLKLTSHGWRLEPNPHFAFMASNLCWWTPPAGLGLSKYLQYWMSNRDRIHQLQRGDDDFAADLAWLQKDGILSSEGLRDFHEHFTSTRRKTANLCPGLSLGRKWDLEDAARLDIDGQFVTAVQAELLRALETWGQLL